MRKNKIYKICKDILKITNEEIEEIQEIAEGQMQYINPLRPATQAKQNALGEHNNKVLNKLIELKEVIEAGADLC